jgi:putative peptidoglycan lipid II flippase
MSLARNVATVGSASLISRVLGFARDMGVAALFGAGARADAFFIAFQLANLIRRMRAEGALNAAVVPLYLRARDEGGEAAAAAFAGRLIGTAIVVLSVAAMVLALAMPAVVLLLAPGFAMGGERMTTAVEMARLMLPYLAFAGPLAVLMGVLNAKERFATAAFASAAFNLVMLAALALALALHGGNSALSGRIVATAVSLAGVAQVALLALASWTGRLRVTPWSISFGPEMRRFFALAAPGLIAGGIPQITVIGATMVASASPGAVSWIYYANRLIELPLGIVGIAIGTVLVPAFTHAVRACDRDKLAHAESRGLELSLGLALPAAIALAVLAEPIVRVLFEHGAFDAADTDATAAALAAFAIGLPGHVLVKTFAPVFFAREDTGTPMRAALIGFIVAIAGSLLLMPAFGHAGIALAVAASGWTGAALLGVLIARRFGFSLDDAAKRRLPRIVLAAVLMGLALEGAERLLAPWLGAEAAKLECAVVLAIVIALGLALYLVLLRVLGVSSLREWMRALRPPLA